MARLYKVHPAIGICRVGDASSFFIGPERIGSSGHDFAPDGSESPIREYKDGGRIKRQGARFRVFEYDLDDSGAEVLIGEVPGVRVEWRVMLANSKAAENSARVKLDGSRRVLVPEGPPRNGTVRNRESLIIRSQEAIVSGSLQGAVALDQGRFLGVPVPLGDVLTDASGNLIVLGGKGHAAGVPETPGGPIPELNSYVDNDGWYDDVSDGSIRARVTQSDGSAVEAFPSWVVCGPPDFAPMAMAPVTLYDIVVAVAIDRGWRKVPAVPSFTRDILPILLRSFSMRWVHDWPSWNSIGGDWRALSDPTNTTARAVAWDVVFNAPLHDYAIPSHMIDSLTKWRDGVFVDDYTEAGQNPTDPAPADFDRAALEACIATSFFPGIEAGFVFGNATMYSELGRLSHQHVVPGQITAQMALPWQADFNDCRDDWWPSQRPNDVFAAANRIPNLPSDWQEGVGGSGSARSREDMVRNYWKLGFVVADEHGNLIEVQRDDSLPARPGPIA